MQNKAFNFGPVALTTTLTTNILNPAITSLAGPVGFTATQPYLLIRHLHIVNKTASSATFSLWKGTTGANAAGTELAGAISVPANQPYDMWFQNPGLRLDATDFLVGGAGTATALSISGEGEIGFA